MRVAERLASRGIEVIATTRQAISRSLPGVRFIQLDGAASYSAKDLWTKQTAVLSGGSVTAGPIPSHGTVILRLSKVR